MSSSHPEHVFLGVHHTAIVVVACTWPEFAVSILTSPIVASQGHCLVKLMQVDMFENCGSIDACGRLQVLALPQQVIFSTKVYTSHIIGDTLHRTYYGGWEEDAGNCSRMDL